MRSLEIVNIQDCFEGITVSSLLLLLQSVKRLKIKLVNSYDIVVYLDVINLCQLETLQLLRSGYPINIEELPTSLSIKRLEIPYCDCDPSLLVKRFPNLDYLELGTTKKYSLEPLLDLPELKHVSLIYSEDADEHIFAFLYAVGNRNVLETLKLQKAFTNDYHFTRKNCMDDLKTLQNNESERIKFKRGSCIQSSFKRH